MQVLDWKPDTISETGEEIQSYLRYEKDSISFNFAGVRLAKGATSRRHYHKVTTEVYLIRQGRAHFDLDGQMKMLLPGASVVIEPGQFHRIWNEQVQPVFFEVFSVPAWDPGDEHYE